MSKIPLHAFKFEGNGLMPTLITPVVIIPELEITQTRINDVLSNPQKSGLMLNALWDTGANCSCIKPDIAKKLGIDKNIVTLRMVTGVNSETQEKPVYKVGSLILPNNVNIPNFHLTESNIASSADILIGMDLILNGDFSITNYGGKTVFCFSMPPHEKHMDLVERAVKVNKRTK
jgi:hypothetical protein